jgi:membrane-associated phospholipid phosphatase
MRPWREVLGRVVKVSFALAAAWIALCAVFGALVYATDSLLEGPLATIDGTVLAALYPLHVEPLVSTLRHVSLLGRPEITVPLMWLGAGVLFFAGERRGALQTIVTYMGAGNVYVTLAPVFERPRPRPSDDVPFADGWALPSGHVIGALAAALPIAIAVSRRWPRAATAAGFTALAYVGVVAGTRLYLQMHHLSDVLAAMWITAAWYVISDAILQRRRAPVAEAAGTNGTTSAARPSIRASGAPADEVEASCSGDGSLRRA